MESTGIDCSSSSSPTCGHFNSPSSPRVSSSPFAYAAIVAGSPDIRKRSISLADTFERNATLCLDNFQGKLTKYLSENEKMKILMKNDTEQVKHALKEKDQEIETLKTENLIMKTRIEELQFRFGENDKTLGSMRIENERLMTQNTKLDYKVNEVEHSMLDMIKAKDSVIESLSDKFSVLCKELTEREGSIMELYKKQLLENQQLETKSQQLQNKIKQNLRELANLTNLVSQLQLESVKYKKEYETSIHKLREEYKSQLTTMSEMQKSFLPEKYPYEEKDEDFTNQKLFYEHQITSLKKELKQLQDQYENQRKLAKESNESLLKTLSDRNIEVSQLKSIITNLNDQAADLKASFEQKSIEMTRSGSSTHLQIVLPSSPTVPTAGLSPPNAAATTFEFPSKLVHFTVNTQ